MSPNNQAIRIILQKSLHRMVVDFRENGYYTDNVGFVHRSAAGIVALDEEIFLFGRKG